jgi:hypothetical protein
LQKCTVTFRRRDSRRAHQAYTVQKADPAIARNIVGKEMMALRELVVIVVVIIY